MAMPKTGSRPIVVDGQKYRWRVRQKPTYCQGVGWTHMTVSVARFTEPGSVLVVDLGQIRLDAWLGLSKSSAVVPSTVTRTIRAAQLAGWRPDMPGKSFHFQMVASVV